MKKLLATLAALIFCISAGVEFSNPKEDHFVLSTDKGSGYWSPGVGQGELSAADLYRMMYSRSDDSVPACDTVPVIPSRMTGGATVDWKWEDSSDNSGYKYEDFSLYWPAIKCDDLKNPTTVTGVVARVKEDGQNDLGDVIQGKATSATYMFDSSETFWLTAPHSGNIASSHSACDFGQSMNFTFDVSTQDEVGKTKMVTIQMTIKDAMGWWCCRGKEPTEAKSATDDFSRPMYTANTKSDLRGKEISAGYLLVMADNHTTVTFTRTVS